MAQLCGNVRAMKFWPIVVLLFACAFSALADSPHQLTAEPVLYKCDNAILHGCLFRPEGKGPFPAIVFNQSASKPSYEKIELLPFPSLAEFFTQHGYVFFIPGRYGHESAVESTNAPAGAPKWLVESDARNSDVLASINWLKAQSFIDENRIVICGHNAGAIQSLLVAEKKPDIRGTIAFSVGAVSWKANQPLQRTLEAAVNVIDTPILLLQPQNDYSIEPSRVLGDILRKKGMPNKVKVYPPFGATKAEANLFGIKGTNVWGEDVLQFLQTVTK